MLIQKRAKTSRFLHKAMDYPLGPFPIGNLAIGMLYGEQNFHTVGVFYMAGSVDMCRTNKISYDDGFSRWALLGGSVWSFIISAISHGSVLKDKIAYPLVIGALPFSALFHKSALQFFARTNNPPRPFSALIHIGAGCIYSIRPFNNKRLPDRK